ncbi:hypothetical protein V6N11_039379 [Hibiscus sabdariffa]|uniref:Uncharacterized protein n=1 Tax=Hibiscus sabdariffa TaxID=183260 RepID=A0ABR2SNN7_9ROSI
MIQTLQGHKGLHLLRHYAFSMGVEMPTLMCLERHLIYKSVDAYPGRGLSPAHSMPLALHFSKGQEDVCVHLYLPMASPLQEHEGLIHLRNSPRL